jgi:septum formation protein
MKTAPAAHAFVYLASQSPRRQQLLQQLGVQHRPLLPGADEDAEALEAERAGELPLAYVQRVTRAKLRAAQQRLQARGRASRPMPMKPHTRCSSCRGAHTGC